MPGIAARITGAGDLVFGPDGGEFLRLSVAPPGDARRLRRGEDTVFGAVAHEGAAGGHRGFTARADDDGDGRVDEDPLDGTDNDGDGRIDEDFAAIGDAMVAVHLTDGPAGRPLHLEYYHWAHAHLRSAVFLAATGRPDLVDAGALRVVTRGEPWREVTLSGRPDAGTGHPERIAGHAWISRYGAAGPADAAGECDPGSTTWFGVRILDPGSGEVPEAQGDRLDVALSHRPLPLVVASAASRQQLLRILDQAVTARRGVRDPVTGQRTPWVAPAFCALCRQAEAPAMSWRAGEGGGVVLVASRTGRHGGLPDPDLFTAGDVALGVPDQVRWIPDEDGPRSTDWGCGSAAPWTRLEFDEAPGRIEYVFPGVDPDRMGDEIAGRYLDGRSFRVRLASVVEVPAVGIGLVASPWAEEKVDRDAAPDQARTLRSADHQPTLSPDLLEGWPNPFRDVIRIRYTVPATMGEAFAWKDPADVPGGIDLQAAVPWQGGNPRVTVKIYSISGQELVTLETADPGVGQYSVQWNGTDAYGRQVASGTYFCKLQLDDWSVTRRLVFLR